jgi:hypothetical protein
MRTNFARIVVVDFEFEVGDGDLPRPLCMVAHVLDEHLNHVRTIRRWRGEFDSRPPFDIGKDTLIVGYSLWAELTCFMCWAGRSLCTCSISTRPTLPPATHSCRMIPTSTEPRNASDWPMLAARYGIEGWEHVDKETISRDIARVAGATTGAKLFLHTARQMLCASVSLLRAQLAAGAANAKLVMHWSNIPPRPSP